ncbi:MAG: DNA polymerase III subunit beta [Proteobacteria bacterium]|nr:DNA polymerase III subunit beta [Pseudomonadota bacterium]
MQVNIEQDVLMKGIANTLGVVDRRGSMPILTHCLLEANGHGLVISATDLEVSFKGVYPAEVQEPGAFTVQAHALHSLVKDLPRGRLDFSGNDTRALLSTGESRYKFNVLSPDQFPPIPDIEPEGLVELEVKPLLETIKKIIFSASGDDLRYSLSCVFWEQVEHEGGALLRMVSTDGHRLSLAEQPLPGEARLELGSGILVPVKAMLVIQRFLADCPQGTVKLGVNDQVLCLKAGDKGFSVRLLEKKFPDYRRIIPETCVRHFTFNRQELAEALKRIVILTRDRFRGVVFTLSGDCAEMVHENPEVGKGREVVDIREKTGEELVEPLTIGFNAPYLLAPLGVMQGETVVLGCNEPNRPTRLTDPADPGTVYLVMPMDM